MVDWKPSRCYALLHCEMLLHLGLGRGRRKRTDEPPDPEDAIGCRLDRLGCAATEGAYGGGDWIEPRNRA